MRLMSMKKLSKIKYDYILLLQPTSPFRNENQIDLAISTIIDNLKEYDSLVSVSELEVPILWVRKIENNFLKPFIEYDKEKFFQRQKIKKIYKTNGAIYIVNRDEFLKNKQFETSKTAPFIMNRIDSIDIDEPHDLAYAEYLVTKKIHNIT